MIRFLLALSATLLCWATPALAYWEYGHGVIARIAFDEVRPETRAAIRDLLRQDALLETPTCRIRTIEEAAYWPDCIRPMADRFAYTFPWHYQNVNICAEFDLSEPCPNGNCNAAQIERHARLLADRDQPTRVRIEALAFLAHFVGDLHNPLHAGDNGDLGGNRVAAFYGLIGGRTNLHSIWDGFLAERAMSTPPAGPDGLISAYSRAELQAMKQGDVVDWSREMWAVSRDVAYPSLIDTDPCDGEVTRRPVLTEADVQGLIPTAREIAVKGGMRLSRLLDEALSEGTAPPFRRL